MALQVMLAASYWSLLAPAVEMATSSGGFGSLAFLPVAVGFTLGAAFVYLADLLMPHWVSTAPPWTLVSGHVQLCAMNLPLFKLNTLGRVSVKWLAVSK